MNHSPKTSAAQRTLVTGGAGFIGSHLVDRLVARGDSVVVVDDLSTGRRENIEPILAASPGAVEFVESDFAEWVDGPGAAMGFERIYHLAAAVGVRLVVEDPIRTIETNINQTAAVLRYARATNAPLLLASTSEVYGKGIKSPFSEEDDMVYGPTSRSRWSYACSKAIDEYLALAQHNGGGPPNVIARFFNTVGPRQRGRWGMVLPRFIERALAGEPIEVYGDGTQSRCFCDVRDVVPAVMALLETPACFGRIFNVGHDRAITMMELAHLVNSVLETDVEVTLVPYEEAYTAGFEDLQVRAPDLRRIQSVIDFQPSIPLEQTIREIASTLVAGGAAQ